MQVRDFMIYKVYTATPSTTVKELIDILESNRIGGVPVVDDKDHLVGMFRMGILSVFFPHKKRKYI